MMTKKLFSIATLLLVSVSAYAADVYPMYFESLKQSGGDSAAQQEYWEDLMKYKLWGTTGITFNKEVLHIADESGYNGTASGNITFGNGQHHLGGPILAGGSIGVGVVNGDINNVGNSEKNDTLAGGPLRALGDFILPNWAANNGPISGSFYEGPYCVQGSAKTIGSLQYDNTLTNWSNQISGGLYSHKWVELSAAEAESADSTSYTYERIWNAGDYSETDSINDGGDHYRKVPHYFAKRALGAGTYEQCPSDVPFVDTHLEVPVWPEPDSWKPGVSLDQYNKVGYINIPPETPSDSGTYDLYIDNLRMCCTAETQLYVVMPPGGRLTRIFVRDGFNITNDAGKAKIQVVYAEDESKYNSESGEWDLEGATYITNKAYAGNLMFYTKQDVSWASMTDPSFQGTFMTTGTFRIADHFTLAGQLVASKLWFESKIVGDFRYVPFDPPILAIDPELLEKGAFPENDLDVEIPISLDEKTNTDVSFNYCFDLDKSTASVKDFNKTDMAPFPVCELRDTTWTYTFDEDGETKLDSTVQSVVVTKDSGYVVIKSGKLSPSADMKAYLNVYYDGVEEDDEILNMVIFNLTGAVLEGNKREGSFNLNIIDAVDPPKTEPITLVGAEDLFYTFSKTDFPYTHKRDLEMGGVVIATLPNKGALYYFGQPIKSANTIIPADSIDQLQYKGAKDGYGVPYVTFQFQVIDEVKVRSATTLATIDLAPVNDAPTITATEFTIDENSEVDAVVTGSFTTKDVDDSIFVYSLVDGDTAIFKIDPATGVVSVKKAELDFETKSTYELTVQVRDAAETTAGVGKDSATVTITITLNDVNEVPVLADASADVDENVPAGTEVTTVVATDVDAEDAGKLQYEFVDGNTGDAFAIDKTTGLVTVKGKLNHETIPVYTITVKVTDSKKNSTTAILTITVNDINEKPVIADKTPTFEVDENALGGVEVGSISVYDDDGDVLSYSIEAVDADGADTIFVIDADGKITVKADSTIDYEKNQAYEIRVIVSDGKTPELKDTAIVTINVVDLNEAPTLEDATFTPDENIANGTPVGELVASDPDVLNPGFSQLSYTIVEKNVPFVMDSNVVKVSDSSKLNYETAPSYTLHVVVSDGPNADTAVVTIELQDVNEQPKIVDDGKDHYDIKENSKTGTDIAKLLVKDEDGEDVSNLKVSLTDNNGKGAEELFNIELKKDGSDWAIVVTLADSAKLDYEKVEPSYNVTFSIEDKGGLQDTVIRTINVIDVNEKPEIADANFTPEENAANGSVVGTVVASDPDIKNPAFSTLTYTIIESNSPFKMDGNVIKVADKSKLDYETNPTFVVHVRVTDGSLADTATVTISLKDMPEPPKFTDKTPTFAVDENSPAKTLVGTVSATDVDDGETLIYSLVDPSDKFVVDPATGKITVKADNTLDYETKATYPVSVIVTDKDGLKDTAKVTIKINDVNESPVVAEQTFSIYEHKAVGSVVGTVAASDLDTAKAFTQHVFSSVGGDEDIFKIDANGQITSLKEFDYETEEKTYTLVVKVVDKADPALFVTETMTINIKNVNENPVVATEKFNVDENSKNGTVVGTIEATDPDGDDLTYELVGSSAAFAVTPEGTVVVKDGSKLDFESKSSETITVKVSDPNGGSATKEITVKINDVNEAPVIEPQTVVVPETAPIGSKFGPVKATDPDVKPEYSTLTYTLVGESEVFDVLPNGTIVLKKEVDYETVPEYTIKVSVTDGTYSDTANVTIKIGNVNETSSVTITSIDTENTRWPIKNDTAYINRNFADISWKLVDKNGKPTYKDSSLTGLTDGCRVYVFSDKDKTLDNPGSDSLVVCVSTKVPEVAVSVVPHSELDPSGVTIVESGDDASTTYVNSSVNDVVVVTSDPVTGTSDTVRVEVKLDSVKVPAQTIAAVQDVKNNFVPAVPKEVVKSPENGMIAVTYQQKVNGKTVTVKYYETMDGKPVVSESGEKVVYVNYETIVDGNKVTIAYVADAVTGKPVPQTSATTGPAAGSGSNAGSSATNPSMLEEIDFTITYEYTDPAGNTVKISYPANEKGEIVKDASGDRAYEVSYTYTNMYGNTATSSTKITLDTVLPVVKILSPENYASLSSVSTEVVWTVDGVIQDTLNLQSLENGWNFIVRTYIDKAGNQASDTVRVNVKKPKNVVVELATPVTTMDQKQVAAVQDYYAANPSAVGSRYAVSILNPKTGSATEVLNGTTSSSKPNTSGYEREDAKTFVGPTLEINLKMPSVNSMGGLATVDDIILSDGRISLDSANAGWKSQKIITVDEYIDEHCSEEFKMNVDRTNLKGHPLYKVHYSMKVWIYTSTASFVDQFSFNMDLNNDVQVDDAGMLTMYFSLNPGEDAALKTSDGRLFGTGAYLFKTEIKSTAVLQCDLPGIIYNTPGTKRGNKLVDSDESLTPFGYKRPNAKK